MKKLITALLFATALIAAPAAAADGAVGCSNPCAVDEDGTQGDIYHAESGWYAGDFGPFNGDDGIIEDNGKQDMEPFAYDPSWPGKDARFVWTPQTKAGG